jgi:hypothetical protein
VSDTFAVAVGVGDDSLRLVVRVPSDVDAAWRDREAFQERVAEAVWERLDREAVLGDIARETPAGETVRLGTVTLDPDGTLVEEALSPP